MSNLYTVGDRVFWTFRQKKYVGTVRSIWKSLCGDQILHVESDARGVNGRKKRYTKYHFQVRLIPKVPLDQANVYADWLEENGYNDAAMALRQAFPLSEVR